MLRASLMAAVALSAATAAHAQLANPTAFIEVGISGVSPNTMEGDTTLQHPVLDDRSTDGVTVVDPSNLSATGYNMSQVIEFVTAFGGYGELGVTTDINDKIKGVGLIGSSYSTPKFTYSNDWDLGAYSVTDQSNDEINAGLFSFYVGAGLQYEVAPNFNLGANLKIGSSTLSYENYDYTVTDPGTTTSTATSGEATGNSGDVSGFMVAPEAKLALEVAPTVDFVATAGAGFHFLDGEEFLAGTLTTYQGSAGIRFNLK